MKKTRITSLITVAIFLATMTMANANEIYPFDDKGKLLTACQVEDNGDITCNGKLTQYYIKDGQAFMKDAPVSTKRDQLLQEKAALEAELEKGKASRSAEAVKLEQATADLALENDVKALRTLRDLRLKKEIDAAKARHDAELKRAEQVQAQYNEALGTNPPTVPVSTPETDETGNKETKAPVATEETVDISQYKIVIDKLTKTMVEAKKNGGDTSALTIDAIRAKAYEEFSVNGVPQNSMSTLFMRILSESAAKASGGNIALYAEMLDLAKVPADEKAKILDRLRNGGDSIVESNMESIALARELGYTLEGLGEKSLDQVLEENGGVKYDFPVARVIMDVFPTVVKDPETGYMVKRLRVRNYDAFKVNVGDVENPDLFESKQLVYLKKVPTITSSGHIVAISQNNDLLIGEQIDDFEEYLEGNLHQITADLYVKEATYRKRKGLQTVQTRTPNRLVPVNGGGDVKYSDDGYPIAPNSGLATKVKQYNRAPKSDEATKAYQAHQRQLIEQKQAAASTDPS